MARTKRRQTDGTNSNITIHHNSKYQTSHNQEAYELCHDKGYTLKQLAAHFGVDEATIVMWQRRHSEFREHIISGRDQHDVTNVESALLKRVLGYQAETYTTEDIELEATVHKTINDQEKKFIIQIDQYTELYDAEGNLVDLKLPATKTKLTISDIAPDPKSIFFWLQNRQSDRWKNVRYVEAKVGGEIGVKHSHIHKSLKTIGLEDLQKYLSDAELAFMQEIAMRVQQRKADEVASDKAKQIGA
jgi:transposase-like protein